MAQEESNTIYYSRKYLDINIKQQEKSIGKRLIQQSRLLRRLKRKELRLERKLKKNNYSEYVRYKRNRLTYDSINRNTEQKNFYVIKDSNNASSDISIDSLVGVNSFLMQQTGRNINDSEVSNQYINKLNVIQSKSHQNLKTQKQIKKRTQFLSSFRKPNSRQYNSVKSIAKQSYYSTQKINAYNEIAQEPTKTEEKLLEYLQGVEGFDESISSAVKPKNGMQSFGGMSPEKLEGMGFQTKRLIDKSLTAKLGSGNLAKYQKTVSDGVKKITTSYQKVGKTKLKTESHKKIFANNQPKFKSNPMRGKPFAKRLEIFYNWQTTKATINETPAMLELSCMVGFKHTQRLSYGLGISTIVGLGQSWNDIDLSFQGIGIRTYCNYKLLYGFSAYSGYELRYKKAFLSRDANSNTHIIEQSPFKHKYSNTYLLIGISKTYKINNKWSGAIQVLCDIWWKEKGLKSPFILRLGLHKP